MAKCPDCGTLIDLDEDEVEEGESFSCPECGVDLEVVNIHPLELDVVEDEDEEDEEESEGDELEGEEDSDEEDEEYEM